MRKFKFATEIHDGLFNDCVERIKFKLSRPRFEHLNEGPFGLNQLSLQKLSLVHLKTFVLCVVLRPERTVYWSDSLSPEIN